MVIVRICGGLGNQMFQFAFAKYVSLLKSDDIIKFDLSWFKDNQIDTKREFGLDIFDSNYEIATDNEIKNVKNSRSLVYRVVRKFSKNRLGYKKSHIIENISPFPPKKWSKNLYLDGYWQKESHLLRLGDDIHKLFQIKRSLSSKAYEILEKIKGTDSVSLHIRRGDYISNQKIYNFHGVCDREYYENGISFITHKVQDPNYFIFSDDIDWCKLNFDIKNATFIDFKREDFVDLHLMKSCKHNIIANSSFSYWGAYLNQNLEKIVISPKRWFKDQKADKNSQGLLPKSWIKI